MKLSELAEKLGIEAEDLIEFAESLDLKIDGRKSLPEDFKALALEEFSSKIAVPIPTRKGLEMNLDPGLSEKVLEALKDGEHVENYILRPKRKELSFVTNKGRPVVIRVD